MFGASCKLSSINESLSSGGSEQLPPLYINPNFKVLVDTIYDPASEAFIEGYGVYNLSTGVREAETRRFAIAIALADMFHEATINKLVVGDAPPGRTMASPPYAMPQSATLM